MGWLVGLSSSPTVGSVLGIVLGALTAGVATLASLSQNPKVESGVAGTSIVNAILAVIALSLLVVGLALGSAGGVWSRTHDVLSPSREAVIEQWVRLGVDRKEVVQHIFAKEYGSRIETHDAAALPMGTTVYSLNASELDRLSGLEPAELRVALRASPERALQRLEQVVTDDSQLAKVFEIVCNVQSR
jgi:hypothetical protein